MTNVDSSLVNIRKQAPLNTSSLHLHSYQEEVRGNTDIFRLVTLGNETNYYTHTELEGCTQQLIVYSIHEHEKPILDDILITALYLVSYPLFLK
ncbi:hypothetical protein SRABI96_04722 [Peribacillus sp. Bi96]|uniref:hypothetical protein n=1 Tax=unclassified Peribacillus TaxID=2675266 RepID=UPI001D208FCA|nr:hypothetical protein [Peribacillus sp. Bi96]CAH0304373.1 hypothetical protein SRABI96_04722 [Peribacillus sp. Bi96]